MIERLTFNQIFIGGILVQILISIIIVLGSGYRILPGIVVVFLIPLEGFGWACLMSTAILRSDMREARSIAENRTVDDGRE